LNEEESQDITRPETEITVSGFQKLDYFVRARIELTATDNNAGVFRTNYSIDGGQTWETYNSPFRLNTSGEISFKYFSTDNAGNPEPIKEETIPNIGLEIFQIEGDPIIIQPNP
jgi:hypothetical protein